MRRVVDLVLVFCFALVLVPAPRVQGQDDCPTTSLIEMSSTMEFATPVAWGEATPVTWGEATPVAEIEDIPMSGFFATPVAWDQTTPVTAPVPFTCTVVIRDFDYQPRIIEIPIGTKVIWQNRGDRSHTVSSLSDMFESFILEPDETYAYVFRLTGQFRYKCDRHHQMRGTVIVR